MSGFSPLRNLAAVCKVSKDSRKLLQFQLISLSSDFGSFLGVQLNKANVSKRNVIIFNFSNIKSACCSQKVFPVHPSVWFPI